MSAADPVAELLSDPRFRGKPITWAVTPESYDAIRRAWLTHVHAEEVLFKPFTEETFNAQMEVMLSVFTDDCVMELASTGERWQGHRQAADFYRVFLGALEEMEWIPQALVIGPQGVLDVVNMTGKLVNAFAGLTPSRLPCASPMGDLLPMGAGRREVQGRSDLFDPSTVAAGNSSFERRQSFRSSVATFPYLENPDGSD